MTSDIQAWFTQRFHDHYYERYLFGRGYTASGEAVEHAPEEYEQRFTWDNELSESAARADRDNLPGEVGEWYASYRKSHEEQDIGSARVYVVPVADEVVYVVRVTTDGDDGYLEIFDEQGAFLAAGRTHLDLIAWGTRDWLREQVAKYGEYPTEFKDAYTRSLYGKPLPWDCQVACWQCRATGQVGFCRCRQGHRQEIGDLHACNHGSHTWDDSPPDPRIFAKPRFEVRTFDGRVFVGTLNLVDNKMPFTTSLGILNLYPVDIRKIEFATINPHDLTSSVALAIHKLGSAQADEIAQAEAELLAAGARAYAALMAAASCGDGAINRRAGMLAARIKQTAPAELLSLRKLDIVTTPDAKLRGQFDSSRFALDTAEGFIGLDRPDLHLMTQLPGPPVEVPRENPRWLGRIYTDWYGAKLSFIVTGNVDDGDVFGSDPYTLGSMLATAAIHAGRVKHGETKVVRVEILLAPAKFVGSEQNGVTSLDWEEPETGAFRFID